MANLADLPFRSELRELYDYNPLTGELTRLTACGRGRVGQIIESPYISVNYQRIVKTRAIWCWYYGSWPPDHLLVDHKNGDTHNNRIFNLRLATKAQNAYNMGPRRNGPKGVYQVSPGCWSARISIEGKQTYIGCYKTEQEAGRAYEIAAEKVQGEFACHL